MYKTITEISKYRQLVSSLKLTVVYFHSTDCIWSQVILPTFQELSLRYDELANFAMVIIKDDHVANCDTVKKEDIAEYALITVFPTFTFSKKGQEIDRLAGANGDKLRNLIEHHIEIPEEGEDVCGHKKINRYIRLSQVDCFNQQENNSVQNIFKSDNTYLESDVDDQLMISIPFRQPVKLHSIRIIPKDNNNWKGKGRIEDKIENKEIDKAPKEIKLFLNRPILNFEDIDYIEETQLIKFTEKDYKENSIIPLKYVTFQCVSNIVLFIQNNIGDEETTAFRELILFGSPVERLRTVSLKEKPQFDDF